MNGKALYLCCEACAATSSNRNRVLAQRGLLTKVREGIEVKRVASPDNSQDTFILCRSTDRRMKEAAIHDRFERRIEERLGRIEAAVRSGRLRSRDTVQLPDVVQTRA